MLRAQYSLLSCRRVFYNNDLMVRKMTVVGGCCFFGCLGDSGSFFFFRFFPFVVLQFFVVLAFGIVSMYRSYIAG